jgi:hypothetical protein
MKIVKLFIMVSLIFVMYKVHKNDNFLFLSFLALSILSFFWVFKPLWTNTNIIDSIKSENYFRNYNTYKFLFISIALTYFIFTIDINRESGLYYYFFVLKVTYILMMDFVLFLRLVNPHSS